MKPKFVIVLLVLFTTNILGQKGDYFLGSTIYPFVQYDKSVISFPGDSTILNDIYTRIDSLMLFGEGKINIVHIGGSHIQADMYTHVIRKELQTLQYDMNGGRGMLFPYRMAKTNNPSNYSVRYSGSWESCKNTQRNRSCELGLMGYAITTSSKTASITINPNNDTEIGYRFSKVSIFHNPTAYKFLTRVADTVYYGSYDSINGCSIFILPELEKIKIQFFQNDTIESLLAVYGISLDTDEPGIVYNSVGVNGAKLVSYLESEFYSQHLSAIKPDLIVFSLGTNDANTKYFDRIKFRNEYIQLIEKSKLAAPDAVILITVPNDCYYYKRYVNKNTPVMQKEIFNIAREYNYGVWDFYTIMGGLNSSQTWYNYGLMKYDRIHFNRAGYNLKANLFTTAFLRGWEQNLTARTAEYFNKKEITAEK
ncbi:MAG: hypothetical protein JXA77_03345 [Bacteroidales bacterium]|nr:hypothetical protein [Bacteroidales bacterium]MBN2818405.1 hypothetical protein [Bacteroidales bacterium]